MLFELKQNFNILTYHQTMIKKNKQRVISVPYNSSTNPVESLDYIF